MVGENLLSSRRLRLSGSFFRSPLCGHPVCGAGFGATVHTQRDHRLLQHRPSTGSEIRMALSIEGEHKVYEAHRRVLCSQLYWHAGESPSNRAT